MPHPIERLRASHQRMRELGPWLPALVAYAIAHLAWLVLQPPAPSFVGTVVSDAFLLPCFLVTAISAWRTSRLEGLDDGSRRAWTLLTLTYLLLWLGNVIWVGEDVTGVHLPVNLGRALVLASYPPLYIGALAFPAAPRGRAGRLRLALDLGIVVAASALADWYAIIRTDPTASLVSSLPAVLDLGVIAMMAMLLIRRPDPASRVPIQLLAAGHLISVLAGFLPSLVGVTGRYVPGNWVDALWMFSSLLIFYATVYPRTAHAARSRAAAPRAAALDTTVSALPYAFVALAVIVALLALPPIWRTDAGIVAGTMFVVLCLVIARQIAALLDNRRLAREQLAQEARFRSLVQHSSDVITVVDADGLVAYESPSARRVFGAERGTTGAEAPGAALLARAEGEDRLVLARLLDVVAATPGATVTASWRARRGDGWTQVETTASNLLDDPAVRGIVLNSRDMTDRLALEDQLRQAQKMEAVGRLAGGVAHDFNNLLTAIQCHAALLADGDARGVEWRHDVREIELAVERARRLTGQLLSFGRRSVVRRETIALDALVDGMTPLLRTLAGGQVAVTVRHDPGLRTVDADRGQLEQVLMNLVVNARDAMPEGGTLEITTTPAPVDAAVARAHPGLLPGEYSALRVRDSGTGMPGDVLEHLFEPFFTTKPQGTGLGLATVYGIVAQARGHIAVTSAPGAGTEFVVYLPTHARDEADVLTITGETRAVPPRGAETVLVVDDEESVRMAIRRILQKQGYAVLTASDGEEALEVAAAHAGRIHLLLTDIMMPRLDGRALVDRFTVARPATRVALMSGFTDDVALRDELGAHGQLFLAKPFSVEALLRVVRQALDAPAAVAAGA